MIKKATLAAVAACTMCGVTTARGTAPQALPRPHLVVGILIDGLSMEQLELMRSYMGRGGFNRLIENGVTISDLDYGTQVDAPTAAAIIYTGAAPAVNGIAAAEVYEPSSRLVRQAYYDPSVMGNFTSETLSPRNLAVSTLGDELRIDADGLGRVYAIAPDAGTSLAMAGHAGNSAVWLDRVDGNWASSTYYSEIPTVVATRNRMTPLAVRLDTIAWTNLLPIGDYPDVPSFKKTYPVRNSFVRKDPDRYNAFAASAPFNTEATDVACEYVRTLKPGTKEYIDMLSVGYTVQPYEYSRDPEARIEQLDAYVRLDRELERLFDYIDKNAGLDNTMIFVAGTPRRGRSRRDDVKWGIPHGEFSPRRAISLINLYLTAKHGAGEWVNGYHNNNFYLNHALAKERNIDARELRDDVAKFVVRMEGVTEAFTIEDILDMHAGINAGATRNNTHIATAGDVLITVAPGWQVSDGEGADGRQLVERGGAPSSVAFIMSPDIAPQIIDTPVDARRIAPTVSRVMRIRPPNAASLAPLNLRRTPAKP